MSELRDALQLDGESKSFDHFGRDHVLRVLGVDDMKRLSDVRECEANAWFVPAESRKDLAYLVVGFSASAEHRTPRVVLLAGQSATDWGCIPLLTDGALVSGELMRVRSGLMRMETAERLVAALTCSPTPLAEALVWAVVEGPSTSQAVRGWMDQWPAAEELLLRLVLGFRLAGELGGANLTMLRLERGARLSTQQAFAYGAPILELPPRYRFSAVETGGQDGLPPEYEVWVSRARADDVTLGLVATLEASGLLAGLAHAGSRPRGSRLAEVADRLWPQFEPELLPGAAARSYASAFAVGEVQGVLQALKQQGLRQVQVHDWRVEVPELSDLFCGGRGVQQREEERCMSILVNRPDGSEMPLAVRIWSCIALPLHLPENEWPAWALESRAMLEADADEQDWQHRAQLRDYLDEFDSQGTTEA